MHVALAGSTKKCFISAVIFLALVSMLFPNVPTKLISVGPPVARWKTSMKLPWWIPILLKIVFLGIEYAYGFLNWNNHTNLNIQQKLIRARMLPVWSACLSLCLSLKLLYGLALLRTSVLVITAAFNMKTISAGSGHVAWDKSCFVCPHELREMTSNR